MKKHLTYNNDNANGNVYKNGSNNNDDSVVGHMSECYRSILASVGENPMREGLLKTPERASKALLYFTKGYTESLSGKLISFCFP